MRALARHALTFDVGVIAGLVLAAAWRDYRHFKAAAPQPSNHASKENAR